VGWPTFVFDRGEVSVSFSSFWKGGGPTGINRERGEGSGWDLRGNGGNGDGSFLEEGK
jgi:hypothetical protein